MKLSALLAEYEKRINAIHEGRKIIRATTKSNRQNRKELDEIKEKMRDYIADRIAKGKTLYQICQDEFGKVDRRFHVLFALFRGKE